MLAALIVLAISFLSVNGEIEQRDVQKDSVEFSKLKTDAF
jgi:hypothetical protein